MNVERLDIQRATIGHPSKKLLSLDFAQSFFSEFRAFQYTAGHSLGHPSKKLLSFEFPTSFRFQFGASRYIT